jgi:DNA-binding response OmpR family regulator
MRYMGARDTSWILLADDNENDVLMFRRAARRANFNQPLQVVSNGEETIAYLKGEDKYQDRAKYPLPALVLLDLKMPRKDGFAVLEWMREQSGFETMQVVVLSSSDEIRDINRAYELGANSFLVKPVSFDEFVGMLEALRSYCLRVWQTMNRCRPIPSAAVPAYQLAESK